MLRRNYLSVIDTSLKVNYKFVWRKVKVISANWSLSCLAGKRKVKRKKKTSPSAIVYCMMSSSVLGRLCYSHLTIHFFIITSTGRSMLTFDHEVKLREGHILLFFFPFDRCTLERTVGRSRLVCWRQKWLPRMAPASRGGDAASYAYYLTQLLTC